MDPKVVQKIMREIEGYVPQRESVDWDFPVSVFDVVLSSPPSTQARRTAGRE